jgi:hypothetical protein
VGDLRDSVEIGRKRSVQSLCENLLFHSLYFSYARASPLRRTCRFRARAVGIELFEALTQALQAPGSLFDVAVGGPAPLTERGVCDGGIPSPSAVPTFPVFGHPDIVWIVGRLLNDDVKPAPFLRL